MSYSARYAAALKHELDIPEHHALQEHLAHYKTLQNAYGVKQSDVERARKVAQLCGLEVTGQKGRVDTSSRLSQPKESSE